MSNSDHSHDQHADGIQEAGKKPPVYFNLLFFGLIAWGVLFMGYYLLSGWSSDAEFNENMANYNATYNKDTASQNASAGQSAPASGAAALFADNCAGCHGADGKGGFGSDLTKSSYKYGKSVAEVKETLLNGRGDRMPAYGGQLSAAEIDALVDYIINL